MPEAAIDLLKRQQGFWFDDGAFAPLLQPGRRQPIEAFMQLGHPFGQNGEAASRRVAAVANQQIVAVLERLVGGKANRRPHRGPQAPIPFGGQQGHRPAEAFHQTGGNDADHAMVPVGLGQEQEWTFVVAVGLHQRHGFRLNRLT